MGDGLVTDMLGAARYGIGAISQSRRPCRRAGAGRFRAIHELGGWHPILAVEGLDLRRAPTAC